MANSPKPREKKEKKMYIAFIDDAPVCDGARMGVSEALAEINAEINEIGGMYHPDDVTVKLYKVQEVPVKLETPLIVRLDDDRDD